MLGLIADIITGIFLAAGSFFVLVGALGLVRMPDVFTRMHAISMIETSGAGLILIGLMFQSGLSLITLKLAVLLGILVFTSPVAGHALSRAALYAGVRPHLADQSHHLADFEAEESPRPLQPGGAGMAGGGATADR